MACLPHGHPFTWPPADSLLANGEGRCNAVSGTGRRVHQRVPDRPGSVNEIRAAAQTPGD